MDMKFQTIKYDLKTGKLIILDQTRLPGKEAYLELKTPRDVYWAIKNMNIRGAPLIGVAAGYGVVLAGKNGCLKGILKIADYIKSARPTAVNLSWAIERMKAAAASVIHRGKGCRVKTTFSLLLNEARNIENEDKTACRQIGKHGAGLIKTGMKIMVHCNAGALATSGMGTALGILYTAKAQGKKFQVYSCETRPVLQGARLTTWELTKNNIETYCVCDNMAASYMPGIDLVLVGADCIARNGDTANKIGTKGLAIIARYHKVPFYVAAPTSSFDLRKRSGAAIPIEFRRDDEIRQFHNRIIAARKAKICNPAFDITPASLITAIITEKGMVRRPYHTNIKRILDNVK